MSRNESNSNLTSEPTNGTLPSSSKLCHIIKRSDFEGYGFNLHSEKAKPGQYIGKVDVNSPAEEAGLKEGDRIVEVNAAPIGNDTHKQVVQRIKAISCEVRLLLIDVDGKGHGVGDLVTNYCTTPNEATSLPSLPSQIETMTASSKSTTTQEYQGTVQELPGASANISSISMTSTKRISNGSNQSNGSNASFQPRQEVIYDSDIAENIAMLSTPSDSSTNNTKSAETSMTHIESNGNSNEAKQQAAIEETNNNKKYMMTTPPPPSATIATVLQPATNITTNTNGSGSTKSGGLQLSMTAAEMRAKLLSKKKYDPKNESVDLKKKFEIIQKL